MSKRNSACIDFIVTDLSVSGKDIFSHTYLTFVMPSSVFYAFLNPITIYSSLL